MLLEFAVPVAKDDGFLNGCLNLPLALLLFLCIWNIGGFLEHCLQVSHEITKGRSFCHVHCFRPSLINAWWSPSCQFSESTS